MATLFVYQGHTMTAQIWGDAQLEVSSLGSKPITHGVYPINFAEGEAWDILAEAMENQHAETIKEANQLLYSVVQVKIKDGVFQEFTPERGKAYKW
jgi:hypothetical protein